MAKYEVRLVKKAQKQLDKLPDLVAGPILKVIFNLKFDPRPPGSKKLKGRSSYRVRSGNYRVIYEVLDTQLVVKVIALGHRKDIYG
ncbi:type II toxin-antitoxin system RelE/ParE family toxin [Persicitalea sp.]|uniref:type II toxin-antitoxin system RelE family toxin n=1 Tax=Persicitalea sp. TaxID=3100273 RepID=UPI0035931314